MLNLFEVSEFKTFLKENNGGEIHMHDTCGGQYFTIEKGNDDTERLVNEYLTKKKNKVIFSDDKASFTIL